MPQNYCSCASADRAKGKSVRNIVRNSHLRRHCFAPPVPLPNFMQSMHHALPQNCSEELIEFTVYAAGKNLCQVNSRYRKGNFSPVDSRCKSLPDETMRCNLLSWGIATAWVGVMPMPSIDPMGIWRNNPNCQFGTFRQKFLFGYSSRFLRSKKYWCEM